MFYKYIRTASIISFLFLSLTHLTQAQTPTWTQLSPNPDPTQSNNGYQGFPQVRAFHTAISDIANNRMTIYGGTSNPTFESALNDVWVLSHANGQGGTSSWTEIFPSGSTPLPRSGHSAIYDATNNRMVIFGGTNYALGTTFNDVWILSNANGLDNTSSAWTELFPSGGTPAPRSGHSAIYDTTNNRMVILGSGSNVLNVWVLTNANGLGGSPAWTQLSPNPDPTQTTNGYGGFPMERYGHTAVYDAIGNRVTIFGGQNGSSYPALNDVWVLSNANGLGGTPTWTELSPIPDPTQTTNGSGGLPTSRSFHTAVYNNTDNRMTIYGGENVYYNPLNDVWALSYANGLGGTSAWTQLSPAGSTPGPRMGHTAVYDATNNNMTIFGCYNGGSGFNNEVWVLLNTNGLASSPLLSNPPALKAFIGVGLTTVFNLEDYNSGGSGTSYSLPTDFLSLGTTNGSYVSETVYDTATTGTNTYQINNDGGSSSASGLVKYSTYRIRKLPHVGLTPGSSWDVNVGNYTYDTSGLALPPSFGNPTALIISNLSSVTAYWINDSIICITSLQSFTGVVDVDIIASPNATSPFGSDIDKERIYVYTNLLSNGTFSIANDTIAWSPMEIPPGRTTMATQQWIPSYTDSAGTQATGIWQFTFADASGGVKATPAIYNWINITDGQWYTFRIRLAADSTNNSHQALLFGYTNFPGAGTQTDIVGNVLFGVPTVWTWQEAPLLVHGSSYLGYPQFQFKAGGAGSIYVDEIQIINAAPELVDARSNTQFHYLYGQFTTGNDTTGWGQQVYTGAGSAPGITVNNGLVLNFAGATSGTGQEGIKWTANNGVPGPNAYSFPVHQNYDVNVGLNINVEPGNFNSLGIVLASAYGVQTAGQQNIGVSPSSLMAVAGVGVLESGNYYAEGNAINPYYQAQFGVRSDQPGILEINNVDVNIDHDDPNFGDPTLFL